LQAYLPNEIGYCESSATGETRQDDQTTAKESGGKQAKPVITDEQKDR